tara:strand:+ start:100 stop:876 length:777 start_codon:yes stop_codon:yes gene_type:complete
MLGLGSNLSSLYVPQASSYVNESSVSFDGTNDYIETGNNFHGTFRNSFSISMWFKTPAASAGTTYLVGLDQDSSSDQAYFFIKYDEANNRIHTRFQSSGYATQNYTATSGIGDEAWVHLVYTVNEVGDTSNSVFDVYINGTADTTTESGTMRGDRQSGFTNTDTTLRLARYGSSYGDVIIHDYAMFSGYLTEANVVAMYNSGTPINLAEDSGDYDQSDKLVVYYKLDEGSATTATDSGEGDNNGTLTNGPTWVSDTPS